MPLGQLLFVYKTIVGGPFTETLLSKIWLISSSEEEARSVSWLWGSKRCREEVWNPRLTYWKTDELGKTFADFNIGSHEPDGQGTWNTMNYLQCRPTIVKHVGVMMEVAGFSPAPVAPQLFGNAGPSIIDLVFTAWRLTVLHTGKEHMQKYGTKPEHFAQVAYKNHKHSVNNPYSQFQKEYSLEEIKTAPV